MKIPRGLLITAILSLINIGISLLSALASLIIGKPDEKTLKEAELSLKKEMIEMKKLKLDYAAELLDKFNKMNEAFMSSFYAYHFLLSLIFALGAIGVVLMLKRNKLGFHLYICYSILGIGHMYIFASPNIVPSVMIILSSLISGLFIFLFSRHLPWMGLNED